MIQDSQDVTVMSWSATVENKTCAPSCSSNADCREGETDPVHGDEAKLAGVLRQDPTNRMVAEQVMAVLVGHDWPKNSCPCWVMAMRE